MKLQLICNLETKIKYQIQTNKPKKHIRLVFFSFSWGKTFKFHLFHPILNQTENDLPCAINKRKVKVRALKKHSHFIVPLCVFAPYSLLLHFDNPFRSNALNMHILLFSGSKPVWISILFSALGHFWFERFQTSF